jgi:hypothetical protein
MNSTPRELADGQENLKWLEIVRRQVASLRFGVVEIVVHDSRVTQIEKTERLRLDKASGDSDPGKKE